MVGIVGIFGSREGAKSSSLLRRMSDTMGHRGSERHFVPETSSCGELVFAVRSPVNHDHIVKRTAKQAIVACSWNLRQDKVEQLLKSRAQTLRTDVLLECQELTDALILFADRSSLVISRNGHSTNSLYFQWSEGSLAFSTERKALWSIGLFDGIELEAGQTLRVDSHEPQPIVTATRSAYPDTDKARTREDLLASLDSRLQDSFGCLSGSEGVGVLFSGGVDSSLAALLAQKVCREVTLFTACAENSYDEASVSRAARALDLELEIVPFDAEMVWETLPELMYAIETARKIDVEIALPFFLAARKAKISGKKILISGQGPDELFGGYAKHARLFAENGEDALDEELRSEVRQTHKANIARDEKAIARNGLTAFFPYLNSQFICEALAVPSRWKISTDHPPERKALFRQLAVKMGLPEIIASSPKKATQFSSGSQRALWEAVSKKTKCPPKLQNGGKSEIVQIVLNKVAMEVGMPFRRLADAELSIDLGAARKFAHKIRETSHPQ